MEQTRFDPQNRRERDGANPIERKAVYKAQLEVAAMPASLVVQIALWPDKLADWAKDANVAPPVVYNMLANVKPYHRVRTLLAKRLNVSKAELDHLVEAPRPQPRSRIPPDPPERTLASVDPTATSAPGPSANESMSPRNASSSRRGSPKRPRPSRATQDPASRAAESPTRQIRLGI